MCGSGGRRLGITAPVPTAVVPRANPHGQFCLPVAVPLVPGCLFNKFATDDLAGPVVADGLKQVVEVRVSDCGLGHE